MPHSAQPQPATPTHSFSRYDKWSKLPDWIQGLLVEEGPAQNLKLSADRALTMVRDFVRCMAQPIGPTKARGSMVQFAVPFGAAPVKKGANKKRGR